MKRLTAIIIGATLALAGCASTPAPAKISAAPSLAAAALSAPAPEQSSTADAQAASMAMPNLSPRDRVSRAMDLLSAGKADQARPELEAALAKLPKDATALSLIKQIDTDPAALLGGQSQDYVVQPGDNMSTLASKFLGDRLMFYALSRYNGLSSPNALSVGRTLKMPVRPGMPSPASKAADPALAAATPVSDPAKATGMRLRALELLNTGDIDRAVTLLQQAKGFDAKDAAIGRDLDRALRIQSSLSK